MASDAGDFRVSQVPPEQVDLVWQQVSPMVERGLRHGAGDNTTPEHIRASIQRGEKLLWAVHREADIIAIIVLDVLQHPAKKTLVVVLIAGREFGLWSEHVQQLLKDFAELIGADAIEALVRDGLTRWLARMGWRRQATLMELRHAD